MIFDLAFVDKVSLSYYNIIINVHFIPFSGPSKSAFDILIVFGEYFHIISWSKRPLKVDGQTKTGFYDYISNKMSL